MFKVDKSGNVTAAGTLYHTGYIQTAGDVIASGIVSAGAEMYATQFITFSSVAGKENIVPLDANESIDLLARLKPVRYNFKQRPDRRLLGFIVEEVPPDVAIDTKGVDVMGVVATLAGVVRAQLDVIEDLRARIAALEQRTTP
jgi:hypothetical protein